MNISSAGINLIREYEKCILYAYDDFAPKNKTTKDTIIKGTLTIGWGHTGKDVKKGMEITAEQAEKLFIEDILKVEKSVQNIVKIPLTQGQYDGLCSFTYNCGAGNLQRLVKNRNHQQIAKAILLYNKSKGKVMRGLTLRRQKEQKLFLS